MLRYQTSGWTERTHVRVDLPSEAGSTQPGGDAELAQHVLSVAGGGSPEPVKTEFVRLLPDVSTGRWRMKTGLFVTEERWQMVSFSHSVWALPDGLPVDKANPLDLTTTDRSPISRLSLRRHLGSIAASFADRVQHS